jgi:hypothetical protein
MNKNIPDRLLKFSSYFLRLAEKESLSTILKNIEEMDTYSARKEYAEKKLSHLSSGSSRIVYLTPGKTIVKLAKNDKGIAQNKAEANPKMKSKFLNKILSSANNCAWIEVPYLEKITEKQFEEMTGLKFDDFGESIRYGLRDVSGNTDKEKPDNFAEVEESDIYREMKDIGEKFKLMPGDLARISSWGVKDGKPVLIDAGLTADVFEDFYEDSTT